MVGVPKALHYQGFSLMALALYGLTIGINASVSTFPVPVGSYGSILSRQENVIQNGFQDGIVEKVTIFSKENDFSHKRIERQGILVRYKQAEGTVLMCHGFMCDKYDLGFLRNIFQQGKYNLLTFDMRAHGEKVDGQCCTLGRDEAYDVLAAANFLKHHPDLQGKPLFVYGFSMGAVAAIEAQAKDASLFNAMILDCPFESSVGVLQRSLDRAKFSLFGYEFNLPGKSLLKKYAFHPYVQSLVKFILKTVAKMDPRNVNLFVYPIYPAKSIEKIQVPSFFIHCKRDEKVSVDAIKTVFNGSGAHYKVLWLTNGRGHFDSYFYSPEKYTSQVRNFLDLAMKGSLKQQTRQEIIEDSEENNS